MSIAGRYVAIMELVLMFGFWLWMPERTSGRI